MHKRLLQRKESDFVHGEKGQINGIKLQVFIFNRLFFSCSNTKGRAERDFLRGVEKFHKHLAER